MKATRTLPLLLSGAFLLFALVGCEKKEGPAEQAGKSIDKGMEKAGEKMEDAGDKMKDKAKGY